MAAVYAVCGGRLLALMPHGGDYVEYAKYMPWLVAVTVMTSCQVFFTNAEVSAGRFGFLWWLVPLHIVYPVALTLAAKRGLVANLGTLIAWFAAASAARFLFCLFSFLRRSR